MSSVLARCDQTRLYVSADGGVNWTAWSGGSAGADGAILDGASSSIKATVFSFTNSHPLAVVLRDTNGDYVSVGGGTQYTEDAASVADPIGNMLMARRRDAPASEVSTDGDNIALNASANGELYVKILGAVGVSQLSAPWSQNLSQVGGTTTSVNSGTKDAGTLRVVLATDQPALTNKLLVTPDSVALPANQSVNVAQFGGTNVVTGVGAAATGVPRVTVSNDNVESTAPAGSTAVANYTVACAGMVGVGGALTPTGFSGTYNVQYSDNNGTTYRDAIFVLNGAQTNTTKTLTTSSVNQDIHLLMGEGWTHVQLQVLSRTAGTYEANIRATRLISPLSVGALNMATSGNLLPFWYGVMAGTNGATVQPLVNKAPSTAAAFTDAGLVVDLRPGGVLPVAAASADGLANPTITQMGSDNMLFNGTTWDRQHNNWKTTTGDSGAKTANFTGATQTNFDSRGAYITLMVGAVSGTITTFQTFLQWSPDGGTTWLGFTPLGANVTTPANGNTFVWTIYPANTSQAAGVTPANLAPAATAPTQINFINASLPRSWRFAANIAGTTPSITFSSVQVQYQV